MDSKNGSSQKKPSSNGVGVTEDLLGQIPHSTPPLSKTQCGYEEIEDQFPFEETPDQLRTIKEVLEDMRRPHPMERLIIGDSGYGKTEVAMRAVFKAVEDGRQAALLAPTTILSLQHFESCRTGLPAGLYALN